MTRVASPRGLLVLGSSASSRSTGSLMAALATTTLPEPLQVA
jgi:hypothetical protein